VLLLLLLLLGSLDTDNNEEWAITLNVAGQTKCLVFYTDNTMPFASPIDPNGPLWEAEFSAPAGQTFRLGFEAWEKQAGGPMCVFENSDNRNNYLRWVEPLTNLSQLAPNEQRPFSASRAFTQAGNSCTVTILGSIARKPSVRNFPSLLSTKSIAPLEFLYRNTTRTRYGTHDDTHARTAGRPAYRQRDHRGGVGGRLASEAHRARLRPQPRADRGARAAGHRTQCRVHRQHAHDLWFVLHQHVEKFIYPIFNLYSVVWPT
jgi:hypothetical protein